MIEFHNILSLAISSARSHDSPIDLNRLFIEEIHVVGGRPLGRSAGIRAFRRAILAGVCSSRRIRWPNQLRDRSWAVSDHGVALVAAYSSSFDILRGHRTLSTAVLSKRLWKASIASCWLFVKPHNSQLHSVPRARKSRIFNCLFYRIFLHILKIHDISDHLQKTACL